MKKSKKKKVKAPLYRKIVDIFIAFLTGIIILFLIFLGFSQTHTFREMVREEIISTVNTSTNGILNIEKIDGTIITSVFLRNTSLVQGQDTLFFAEKIEIKSSPLQLLLRKIYFRKIALENVKVRLMENENGIWNISALEKQESPENSTNEDKSNNKNEFYFAVQVNELSLKNVHFIAQTFEKAQSDSSYKNMNTDDLRIKNLNLEAAFLADIKNDRVNLLIDHLSMNPNFDRFNLQKLSGKFEITKDYSEISDLEIRTYNSSITLNARLEDFNLFGDLDLKNFQNYPMSVELEAAPFNFDDLSSFLSATELLKGAPEVYLEANGKFGDFQIKQLSVEYLNTYFNATGQMKKLHRPENLYIIADIENSNALYENVNRLLPSLELPIFENLNATNLTAHYEGEPTKYSATVQGDVEDGSVSAYCYMDLQTDPMEYDAWFETTNANLFPIIGVESQVNSSGKIKGVGVNPLDLDTRFEFAAFNSTLNGYNIDSLFVQSSADSKIITLNSNAIINDSYSVVNGKIDFNDPEFPKYDITGNTNYLDLNNFFDDQNLSSNLNFEFDFQGMHFDPDTLTGKFTIDMRNSVIEDKPIDVIHMGIAFSGEPGNRNIIFESDIADLNISGRFPIYTTIDLLTYEAEIIPDIITDKVAGLNPLYAFEDNDIAITDDLLLPDIINSDIVMNFDFELKDTELISTFFNLQQLEFLGNGSGEVKNDSDNFSVSTHLDLDYILTSDEESTFYVSDFIADFNLSRDNQSLSFDNLFGTISVSGEKLYSGIEINNIFADLIFNQKKLFINGYAEAEGIFKSEIDGYLVMSTDEQEIFLNDVLFDYKGVEWKNESPINILFNPDYLTIKNFVVKHEEAELNIEGRIVNRGQQDMSLSVNNLPGHILTNYLLDTESPLFKADVNLDSKIRGTLLNPVIDVQLNADSVYYGLDNIGQLLCDFEYEDKLLSTEIIFLDSTKNSEHPNLSITGAFPINLSFEQIENRLPEDEDVALKLKSENFDLSSLGDLLPWMTNQKGSLSAGIDFTGKYSELNRSGYITISDASFTALENNMNYLFDLSIRFFQNQLIVDNIILANVPSAKYPGQLFGRGIITFAGFAIDNIDMTLNGDIALFGQNSSRVSPSLYGDLFVATDGNLVFSYQNKKPFVHGSILLNETDLTYIAQATASNYSNNNFVYNIIIDSTKIERKELEFQKALAAFRTGRRDESTFYRNFDAEIDIKIFKDAKLEFILSKAANQKLIVEARGDLLFENKNGISSVQGEITLLPGSKLEFIKTFEADGLIRFETDITNPYLDIIATYTAGYETNIETGATKDVAVKIKLQGPLSELGKNLANNPDNIAVYLGSRNIENNIPDKRYDTSDAFSFIFVGKFKEDLTTTDRNQVASQTAALNNTAASFLGSVLTSYVNSAVGDVINNIQLSQSGEFTKFSVSGKFENLRYKFGGTTQVFQDINKANIKFEYLFNPNFLLRLERKDPLVQAFGSYEKISELGLKYRFEF
ncbi:hypothetical protein ACFLTH_05395 [Bacteroidota bacterium]